MNSLSRFNNLRYEHFEIMFKELLFEVKLTDDNSLFPNSDIKDKRVEEFKVIVTSRQNIIEYKFYNSIMEKEVSDILKELKNSNFSQIKRTLNDRILNNWAGYDKINTITAFTQKRIYYLFYSIVNCFANDKNISDEGFEYFCANFGYNNDSIKSKNIYEKVLEMKKKIDSLYLTNEQSKYFDEVAQCEEEGFSEDIEKAIIEAKVLK